MNNRQQNNKHKHQLVRYYRSKTAIIFISLTQETN